MLRRTFVRRIEVSWPGDFRSLSISLLHQLPFRPEPRPLLFSPRHAQHVRLTRARMQRSQGVRPLVSSVLLLLITTGVMTPASLSGTVRVRFPAPDPPATADPSKNSFAAMLQQTNANLYSSSTSNALAFDIHSTLRKISLTSCRKL